MQTASLSLQPCYIVQASFPLPNSEPAAAKSMQRDCIPTMTSVHNNVSFNFCDKHIFSPHAPDSRTVSKCLENKTKQRSRNQQGKGRHSSLAPNSIHSLFLLLMCQEGTRSHSVHLFLRHASIPSWASVFTLQAHESPLILPLSCKFLLASKKRVSSYHLQSSSESFNR